MAPSLLWTLGNHSSSRSRVVAIACAIVLGTSSAAGQARTSQIAGTVTYQERLGLAKHATIHVRLEDTSVPEGELATVAEQTITTEHDQVPIPFLLNVPIAQLHSHHKYVLVADIEMGGRIWFKGNKLLQQPPRRHLRNVTIVLNPVQ
jgi:uncharacterized lipoprotein YbaY